VNPTRRRKRLTERNYRKQPAPGSGGPSSHGTNPRAVKKRRSGKLKVYRIDPIMFSFDYGLLAGEVRP